MSECQERKCSLKSRIFKRFLKGETSAHSNIKLTEWVLLWSLIYYIFFFCSTLWLTHLTIPEGAESFSYTTVSLMTLPHYFPVELFRGDTAESFPQNHTPFPLKQHNTISHKLWAAAALNHVVRAIVSFSIDQHQCAQGSVWQHDFLKRDRMAERWWRLICLYFLLIKSSGSIKLFSPLLSAEAKKVCESLGIN